MKYKKQTIAILNIFLFCVLCLNGLFVHCQTKPVEDTAPTFAVAAKIKKGKNGEEKYPLVADELKQDKSKFKVQKTQAVEGTITTQGSHVTNTTICVQILEALQLYNNELFYLLC